MHIAILMTILLRLLCPSASHWTEEQAGCVGTALELTIGYNESCFCFSLSLSLSLYVSVSVSVCACVLF